MSFEDYIQHVGIITIPRNKDNVNRDMLPNLQKVGLGKIHTYVFEENKKGCKKNNGDDNFTLKDLYKIKNDGGNNEKMCNDLCKNLCKNHLHIIKNAYKQGFDNVLVFEDDARFIDNLDNNKVDRIIKWMKKRKKWDVLFLGAIAFPYPIILPVTRDIGRCDCPTEAHAYILSKSGMNKILGMKETNHFDFMLQKYLDDKYICIPSICNQNKSPAMFETLSKKFRWDSNVHSYNRLKSIHNTISVIIPFVIMLICIITSSIIFKKITKN